MVISCGCQLVGLWSKCPIRLAIALKILHIVCFCILQQPKLMYNGSRKENIRAAVVLGCFGRTPQKKQPISQDIATFEMPSKAHKMCCLATVITCTFRRTSASTPSTHSVVTADVRRVRRFPQRATSPWSWAT